MNALAGGGSFAAFPALVAYGLPTQVANASTTMALLPGGLASAWATRHDLVPVGPAGLRAMATISLVGGAAGAALLLATPAAVFDRVVPWLLLLTTVLLALGDRPRRAMERLEWRLGPRAALGTQAVLACYGGYFGGAVGLMMMAAWSLFGPATLKAQTPARIVMVCTANAAAAVGFAVAGLIAWPPTFTVAAGGLLGGFGGGRMARRLRPSMIRLAVVAICLATTALFFARAHGQARSSTATAASMSPRPDPDRAHGAVRAPSE